jgi:hypothetical protein
MEFTHLMSYQKKLYVTYEGMNNQLIQGKTNRKLLLNSLHLLKFQKIEEIEDAVRPLGM